jgi:hypothetical protein
MTPNHGTSPQESYPPYQVIVSKDVVQGGDSVHIRLAGPTTPFKGFFAMAAKVAHEDDASSGPSSLGKINATPNDKRVQNVHCFGLKSSAITHKDSTPKNSVEFDWVAPNEDGAFVILSSFVKDYNTFWVKVPSKEITVKKNLNFFPAEDVILK